MRAGLCALALASLAATTARAFPRFEDNDIYTEDDLQDLIARSKKSPVVENASGGHSVNDDRDPIHGGKTTAKDDPKDLKLLKGLRSSIDKVGTTILTDKNDNSPSDNSEPVREESSDDETDSSRSARQNFPAFYFPEYQEMRYSPASRTYGAAGVTREPQSEGVHPGGGGVGVGVGVGHPYVPQHPVHPLKQLKQLVPNIISAISAILPAPSPAAEISAPPHLPPHPPPAQIAVPPKPLPLPHLYPRPPSPGVIYSKQIMLVPPGDYLPGGYPPHRDIGVRLEYPDYASRFPVYKELPAPAPTPVPINFGVIPTATPVSLDSRQQLVLVVDGAGRGWYVPVGGYNGPPTAQIPAVELSREGDPSEWAGAPGGDLVARAAPATVDQLKAEIEAELKRIERMELEGFQRSLAGAGKAAADDVEKKPVQAEADANVVKGLDKQGNRTTTTR